MESLVPRFVAHNVCNLSPIIGSISYLRFPIFNMKPPELCWYSSKKLPDKMSMWFPVTIIIVARKCKDYEYYQPLFQTMWFSYELCPRFISFQIFLPALLLCTISCPLYLHVSVYFKVRHDAWGIGHHLLLRSSVEGIAVTWASFLNWMWT